MALLVLLAAGLGVASAPPLAAQDALPAAASAIARPAAEAPAVRVGRHPGFRRLALEWQAPMPVDIEIESEVVTLAFGRLPGPEGWPAAAGFAPRLDAVVRWVEGDGPVWRLHLREGVAVSSLTLRDGRILALDFADPQPVLRPAPEALALTPARRDAAVVPPAAGIAEPAPGTATVPAASLPPGPVETARAEPWSGPDQAAQTAPQALAARPAADRWQARSPAGEPLPLPPLSAPLAAPLAIETPPALPPDSVPRPEAVAETAPPSEPATASEAAGASEAEVGVALDADDAPPAAAAAAPDDLLTVTARTTRDGWRFETPEPLPAAIWRRGGELWVVLPHPDGVPGRAWPAPVVEASIETVPHAAAWVFRLAVEPVVPLSVDRDERGWVVARSSADATRQPPPADLLAHPRVVLVDPWLETALQVIPLARPGIAWGQADRDGGQTWLPTLQGAVLLEPDGGAQRPPGPASGLPPRPDVGGLIDLGGPTLPPAALREARLALEQAVFEDPVPERWLALARFLLGQAMPFDALAVLDAAPDTAALDDPALAERLRSLRGVAAILAGRAAQGLADLPDPAERDDAELWLWHAVGEGRLGRLEAGGARFVRSGQAWRAYPLPLRREVALLAGRTALALEAPQVALTLLDQVADGAAGFDREPGLLLLRAEALAARGERGEAEALLGRLIRGDNPDVARRARLLHAELSEQRWGGASPEAIAHIEQDLPAWRGRPEEEAVWRLLRRHRAALGDGLGALEAAAEARRLNPDFGAANLDADRALLERLVEGGGDGDDLAAAVAAVQRYQQLLPSGVERARLLERLASRVAQESDALHLADSLLVHALDEPLPRALEQALRLHLAELRLERHVPASALEALAPLADAESAAVLELRQRAEAELASGRVAAPEPASLPMPTTEEDSVEAALATARALLEGER
ncbi:MAG: hypothetical protein EA356_04715 [Geminicoccaceae bacterium]|nr:MAG: hypothetical protein EA356_04715 [Geminicoccaceae bacterium]